MWKISGPKTVLGNKPREHRFFFSLRMCLAAPLPKEQSNFFSQENVHFFPKIVHSVVGQES